MTGKLNLLEVIKMKIKTLESMLIPKGFKKWNENFLGNTYEKSWKVTRGFITDIEGVRISLTENGKEILYTQFDRNGGFNRRNFSTFKELRRWI